MRSIRTRLAITASLTTALALGLALPAARADDDKSDMSAAAAKMHIEELKVGIELGTNGAVLEDKEKIAAGSPLFASCEIDDLGVGTPVKAIWKGPMGARLAETTQNVTQGMRFMVFKAPDTTLWKPGRYQVDIRLADELADSEVFVIEEAVVQ